MKLFTPFAIRGVELPNRVMLSPMCQYSAADGIANDWHLVHYGRFALGGFGLVMVEATAVSRDGRGTYGDIGLWNDIQAAPLAHIAGVLRANGSVPGIQLNHAGRKSSARRPWEGRGSLDAERARIGEAPWDILAPSALPWADGWIVPNAMSEAQIDAMVENFAAAARRAISAGFDVIEIHSAHGYLLSEFLSPSSNDRTDRYGGSRENRMRFPLAVIERVRAVMPDDKPLFVRISSIDGEPGGWNMDDSVAYAAAAKALGADVIDCSSGGFARYEAKRFPGYQIPYADRVRREAEVPTVAVGLITEAEMAEDVVASGKADIVAIAREALVDPNWPLHARKALGEDPADFSKWPVQTENWLAGRARERR